MKYVVHRELLVVLQGGWKRTNIQKEGNYRWLG